MKRAKGPAPSKRADKDRRCQTRRAKQDRWRRLVIEPLEDRRLLAGTMSAELDVSGNLTIADTDTAGKHNEWTIRLANNGADLEITDANEQFGSAPVTDPPSTLSNDNKTLTIPRSAVTGSITIQGGAGDDTLTVDFSGGNPIPANGLTYDGGGGGSDALVLTGGTFGAGRVTPTGPGAGTIQYDSIATITFSGLEPVIDDNAVTNYTIDATNGADEIAIANDADSRTVVSEASVLFAPVSFQNKTHVIVNGLDGDDRITLADNSAPALGLVSLMVNGGDGAANSIEIRGDFSLADGRLTLAAETISHSGGAVSLGTLNLNGAVLQTGGSLTVSGTTTIAAGPAGDVSLDQAANGFGTVVTTSARNLSLVDANAITLGASTIQGVLNLAAVGVTVSGTLSAGNTSPGANSIHAGTGTFQNSAALNAGAGGSLTVTADSVAIAAAITAHGGITLQPATLSRTIGLNDPAGDFHLANLELGRLTTNGTVTVGAAAGTGEIWIGGAGSTNTLGYSLTLRGGHAVFSNTLRVSQSQKILKLSTGAVTSAAGDGVDVSAATLELDTRGGVGAARNPFVISIGSLLGRVDGDLFLWGASSNVIIRDTLSAGSNTIEFSGRTFTLGASERIDSDSRIHVNGGTLALGSHSQTVAGLTLTSGAINGPGATLTSTTDAFEVKSGSIFSKLAGPVGLNKTTPETVTLRHHTNTFTGATVISAGTLVIGTDNGLGTPPAEVTDDHLVLDGGTLSASQSFTLSANRGIRIGGAAGGEGIFNISGTATVTYNGSIRDAGTEGARLVKTGTGTFALGGENTYRGGTLVLGGLISIAADSGLGTVGPLTLDGGGVRATDSFELAAARGIVLGPPSGSGTGTIAVQNGSTFTYKGIIANHRSGVGTLAKRDGGTLVLEGDNTFTGGTTYAGTTSILERNSGIIQLNHANALGSSGEIRFEGSGGIKYGTGITTDLSGRIDRGGFPVRIDTNANDVTFANAPTGSGALEKLGSGRLTLASTGTTTATILDVRGGEFEVAAGTLELTGFVYDVVFGGQASAFVRDASLQISGGTLRTVGSLVVSFSTGNATLAVSSGNLTVGTDDEAPSRDLVVGSGPGSTAAVDISGGTVDVGGEFRVGRMSGPTVNVSGGTLTASSLRHSRQGTATVNLMTGGKITVGEVVHVTDGSTSGGLTLNLASGGTLTTDRIYLKRTGSTSGTHTLALHLDGGVLKKKAGNGNLVDAIDLSEGTGGTLVWNVTVRARGAVIDTNGFDANVVRPLLLDPGSPGGGLTKQGAGTLTLSGTNTYTGATAVDGGTLLVDGSTTAASNVTVDSGTLGGTGTVGGSVTVNTGGQITGGAVGTAGALTVGNLHFDGGTYLADLIDDTSDTLIVLGTTGLAATTAGTFTLNASGTPSVSRNFVFIESTALISDGFINIAEGSTTTVGDTPAHYTYRGGYGGDDFLLRTDGPASYTGTAGDDVFQIQRAGGNIQILLDGTIIDAFPYNSAPTITLDGGAGSDLFIVDYADGNPIPASGLFIIGGESPGDDDRLILQGGSLESLEYTDFTSVGNGRLIVNGNTAAPILFTERNPINVTSSLGTVTITVNDASEDHTITFTQSGSSAMVADAAGTQPMTFSNPSVALIVNGDNVRNDTIVFAGLGHGFAAPITVDTRGGGAGEIQLNTDLVLGSGALTGAVSFTAETIRLNSAIVATNGGTDAGNAKFVGTVVLQKDVTIATDASIGTDGTIRFTGDVAGGGNSLLINGAAVIGNSPDDSLTDVTTLTVTGAATLNANTVTTSRDQRFQSTLTLGEGTMATLTTGGGNLTISGETRGTDGGLAETLTMVLGAGTLNAAAISGTAGGAASATGLNSVNLDCAGAANFSGAINVGGNVTQSSGTGTTTFLGGGSIGGALRISTHAVAVPTAALAVTGAVALNAAAGVAVDSDFSGSTVTINAHTDDKDAGSLIVGPSGSIRTTGGTVDVTAADVSLAGAINAAAGSGNITLTATTGGIVGGRGGEAANLTGNLVRLQAATGIGSASSAIKTDAVVLWAENTGASGDIRIREVAIGADGHIGVQRLAQTATGGTGDIHLATVDGTIEVLADGSGVHVASAGGTITLDANVTDDSHELPQGPIPVRGNVQLDSSVSSQGGTIAIHAARDILGSAAGTISSQDGDISLTADANASSNAQGENGTIQLAGNISAGTGTVTFSLRDGNGWIGLVPGDLVDGNVTAGNIVVGMDAAAPGGLLRLQGGANTFSGTTTVVDGTLIVNGRLTDTAPGVPAGGDVVVQAGGVLGGDGDGIATGRMDGSVRILAGGVLDPGDVDADGSPLPGRLTVNGDVVIAQDGVFRVQLNGITARIEYDQLRVNGTVDLAGTASGTGASILTGDASSVPFGAELRIIDNTGTEAIVKNSRFMEVSSGPPPSHLPLAEGAYVTMFGQLLNISYQAGDGNNDVVLTTPGRFDFNGFNNRTADHYIPVPGNQLKTNDNSYGWNALPEYFERNWPLDGDHPHWDRLRADGHSTDLMGTAITFTLDVEAGKDYEVMILTGDVLRDHDRQYFTVKGSGGTPATQVVDIWGGGGMEYRWVRFADVFVAGDPGTLGTISMTMQDFGGVDHQAVILAMDVRPSAAVGTMTIHPLGDLEADGVTVDTYTGSGAPADTMLTVTVGANTSTRYLTVAPDLDTTLFGAQIMSDAAGNFAFTVTRPNLTNPVVITVEETSGLARGTLTQTYIAAQTAKPLRFDFGINGSPVQAGFLPVLPQHIYSATRGYGWDRRTAGANRQDPAMSALRTDLAYAREAVFRVALPNGEYSVRIDHSNPRYYGVYDYVADQFEVWAEDVLQYTVDDIAPGTTWPLANSTFTVRVDDGVLDILFKNIGGRDGNFVVSGIDISVGALPTETPQLAVGDPSDFAAAAITRADLEPVVAEATARWEATDLTTGQAEALAQARFVIQDLGGAYLGLADSATNVIRIDDDAAMFGWSLVTGQSSSVTGHWPLDDRQMTNDKGPMTRDGIDLLSVVMHELGHLLGYEHSDDEHDLMAPVLSVTAPCPAPTLAHDSSVLRPPSSALVSLRDELFTDLLQHDREDFLGELLEPGVDSLLAARPAKSGEQAAETQMPRRSRLERYKKHEWDDWFAELGTLELGTAEDGEKSGDVEA